jgi:hypothetical protein
VAERGISAHRMNVAPTDNVDFSDAPTVHGPRRPGSSAVRHSDGTVLRQAPSYVLALHHLRQLRQRPQDGDSASMPALAAASVGAWRRQKIVRLIRACRLITSKPLDHSTRPHHM